MAHPESWWSRYTCNTTKSEPGPPLKAIGSNEKIAFVFRFIHESISDGSIESNCTLPFQSPAGNTNSSLIFPNACCDSFPDDCASAPTGNEYKAKVQTNGSMSPAVNLTLSGLAKQYLIPAG